jgi:uncharacterized protein (DUF111 family)
MSQDWPLEHEELDVLQCDVDDESPQVLGALIDRALVAGALDAHLCPLVMKKNRPGTRVEVLCRPQDRDKFLRFLLAETSTLGVKARRVDRYALPRRMEEVEVVGQKVRVKLALAGEKVLRATPEFEDCRRASEKTGVALREVIEAARSVARKFLG